MMAGHMWWGEHSDFQLTHWDLLVTSQPCL